MTDPFSNEALQQTLNTQVDIYRNIRNKALEEAAQIAEGDGIMDPSHAAERIRALKVEE